MDIDTLQSLNSKGMAGNHLSGELHIGGVSKFLLIAANVFVYEIGAVRTRNLSN